MISSPHRSLITSNDNSHGYHREIFLQSTKNSSLWIDLNKSDQHRLWEARKEYDRCKDSLVINDNRSTRAVQFATLVERAAYLAFFVFQAARCMTNPSEGQITTACSSGFHAAISGLGMTNTLINCLFHLPDSLPKIASHTLKLIGIGSELTKIPLRQSQSLKSRAEQRVRAIQMVQNEHLRLSTTEIELMHQFAKQATFHESENHRALLEILRKITPSTN